MGNQPGMSSLAILVLLLTIAMGGGFIVPIISFAGAYWAAGEAIDAVTK